MKIRINKKRIKHLIIYIYLFCFFYFPKFVSSSSALYTPQVVYTAVLVLLIPYIRYATKIYPEIFKSKAVWGYCTLIGVSAVYYLFRYSIAAEQFSIINSRVLQNLFPIVVVINLLVVISIMKKWEFSKEDGIELFLKLASFQGILSLIMLILPSAKHIANTLYLNYATQFHEGSYILTTRIYGISSDYTYGMPIIHGVLCGISIYLGLTKARKYIVYAILIFVNVFLNSRTGLLVTIISVSISLIVYLGNGKISKRALLSLIILPIFSIMFILGIGKYYTNIYNFISVLFQEMYSFFIENKAIGTVGYLTERNLFFPKGLGLIFGEGHRVYGEEARIWGYKTTDIGIVNDLFMGGIVFIALRYGALIKLMMGIRKNKFNNLIIALLMIAWIIANIKGQVTVNTLIVCSYIYLICCLYFLKDKTNSCEVID